MRVMALDPGGTMGVAWAEVDVTDPSMVREVQRSFKAGSGGVRQFNGPTEDHRAWEFINTDVANFEPDVVVIERFILFPNQQSYDIEATSPMRINAKIEFMWWLARETADEDGWNDWTDALPRIVWQMASKKEDITDPMLRKWGLWRTEKRQQGGGHAMDALRHLLVYLKENK